MAKLYFYGHDLDWKPVRVNWRNPYRTVIKAGTPLNANGETANDSNCVGLVMEDSYPKNEFVRVVVKGETDFAMLEEHSGIVLANEVREKLDVYDNSFNSVDWNDLLDRPFGEEVKALVDNVTFESRVAEGGNIGAEISLDFDIVEGQNYVVTFDGVKYNCDGKAFIDGNYVFRYIGNSVLGEGGFIDSGEDTGEPFLYMVIFGGEDSSGVILTTEVGTHTISIATETLKTIDPKYLPSGGDSDGGCVDIKMCLLGNSLTPLDVFDCVNMETGEADAEKVEKILSDVDHALLNNVCRIKIEPAPMQTYEAPLIADTGCYVVNMVHNDETYGVSAFVLGFQYENGYFKDTHTYCYNANDVKELAGLGGEV